MEISSHCRQNTDFTSHKVDTSKACHIDISFPIHIFDDINHIAKLITPPSVKNLVAPFVTKIPILLLTICSPIVCNFIEIQFAIF